jgi:hypothetical protein
MGGRLGVVAACAVAVATAIGAGSISVASAETAPEFGRCVKAAAVKEEGKLVFHGAFTKATCLEESPTHTGHFEWEPGVVKTGVKISLKPVAKDFFEGAEELLKVECTNETGSGTISGPKTVGGIVLTLTGCELFRGAGSLGACSAPGHAAGELQTSTLNGTIGWQNKAKKLVALSLSPVGTETFMAVECPGTEFTAFTGEVLGQAHADAMSASAPLVFKQHLGNQSPEGFEGGPAEVLQTGGGVLTERVGWSTISVFATEEKVEINAVV